MPINFNEFTTTSVYTGVPTSYRDAIEALAQMLDPADAGTLTGTPTGAKRMNAGLFEEFNLPACVVEQIYRVRIGEGSTDEERAMHAAALTHAPTVGHHNVRVYQDRKSVV